jgi:spermidine/putrescine transport system permease protein
MKRRFKFENAYLIFVFALLYLPIFYLIFYAFNQNGNMNAFTGFTLEHFQALFVDSRLNLNCRANFFTSLFISLYRDDYRNFWGDLYPSS